jgi:uncharacterized protein YukE
MSYPAQQGDGPPMSLPPASPGRQSMVNHEIINEVYRRLARELHRLESADGSPLHVRQSAHVLNLTGEQLGRFPAATGQHGGDGFAASCANAHQQISSTYTKFVSAYEELVKALRTSAEGHAEAEQANAAAVKRAYQGPSSPSDAQYFG